MVVTVQRYTETDDGMGGTTNDYVDHLELEGTLDQLSADEVLASDRLGHVSSHIFITFTIADVKRADRFIIDGDIYQVNNVDTHMNMDRQLEITLNYTGDSVG